MKEYSEYTINWRLPVPCAAISLDIETGRLLKKISEARRERVAETLLSALAALLEKEPISESGEEKRSRPAQTKEEP